MKTAFKSRYTRLLREVEFKLSASSGFASTCLEVGLNVAACNNGQKRFCGIEHVLSLEMNRLFKEIGLRKIIAELELNLLIFCPGGQAVIQITCRMVIKDATTISMAVSNSEGAVDF